MVKKTMALEVLRLLKKVYPHAGIALHFGDKFQLLVAVILSAQCTDERVNKVTPPLFRRFPRVEDFAACDVGNLEKMIYSTGFYRNKAKNIKGAAERIVKNFGGKVPDTMEDLLSLPGVARKTANIVLGEAFGRVEGIVVDTHVLRLTGLLGLLGADLSKGKDAVKVERKLMKIVPRKDWQIFAHLLILHGRSVCVARRPKCGQCVLNKICPSAAGAIDLEPAD